MLCKNCSVEIPEGLAFCPNCAAPIAEQTEAQVIAMGAGAPVAENTVAEQTAAPTEYQIAPVQQEAVAMPMQVPAAPVQADSVQQPAQPQKKKMKTWVKVLIIVLAVLLTIGGAIAALFATGAFDALAKAFSQIVEETKVYTVVGEWEFVYGEEKATVFEIDEDHNLILESDEELDMGGVSVEFFYDEKDNEIKMEMSVYGLAYTIGMPCKLYNDFLVVGMPEMFTDLLGLDMDPIVLRRVGTDGDPVEFYKEEFDTEDYLWDPENPDELKEILDVFMAIAEGDMSGLYGDMYGDMDLGGEDYGFDL